MMQATIVHIDYDKPRVEVRVRRRHIVEPIECSRLPFPVSTLRVGEIIEVRREANNPYLVPAR